MIRTLIVDDDPFVRMSLQTILEAQDDVEVCALGADGDEAVELFERCLLYTSSNTATFCGTMPILRFKS